MDDFSENTIRWAISDRLSGPDIGADAPSPRELLLRILRSYVQDLDETAFKRIELFYVRQPATITLNDGSSLDIIPYYTPEFIYVIDLGRPYFPAISVPYVIPMIGMSTNRQPLGHGDPSFPAGFANAKVFSAPSWTTKDILFPIAPGDLLIGRQAGTPEKEFEKALAPYVLSLSNEGSFYRAAVEAFREGEKRDVIARLAVVRYVEFNQLQRDITGRWAVDRVL
jgi:hypothetical protein